MLKKTITYKDLDGNEIAEDFYFRLNKAEIAILEQSEEGGLTDYLMRIIRTNDGRRIMDTFKQIILMSVGRRSEDGRRFIKNDDIRDDFEQTDAFSELFMALVTDADEATEFVKGIVPDELREQAEKNAAKALQAVEPGSEPAWLTENRLPTQKELESMSAEELRLAVTTAQKS